VTPAEIGVATTLYIYEDQTDIDSGEWTQTYGGYSVTGTSGQVVAGTYGVAEKGNFGNFKDIKISGYKWTDLNHDSNWDDGDGEEGVGGWTINLYSWDDGSGNSDGKVDEDELTLLDFTVTSEGTTDANGDGDINELDLGYYEFTGLGPLEMGEKYFVREVPMPASLNTFGSSGYVVDATSGNELAGHYGVGAEVTDDSADGNFGNFFVTSMVTNSGLCDFGDTFRLIYTPDFVAGGGVYKLNASNPGQFYYNGFYNGTAGEVVDLVIEIPYPFVTQGANPFHIYDGVKLDPDALQYDMICLIPEKEEGHGGLSDHDG
jgi:hypothetical protein